MANKIKTPEEFQEDTVRIRRSCEDVNSLTRTLNIILLVLIVAWAVIFTSLITKLERQVGALTIEINELSVTVSELSDELEALSESLNRLRIEVEELQKIVSEIEATDSDAVTQIPVKPSTNLDGYSVEIEYLAKTVWGEARGLSKTEQAAVVWCVLNRVDNDLRHMPDDIISVITQPRQFTGYSPNYPVNQDIKELCEDVVGRWLMEKQGVENIGRVLPNDYLFFRPRDGHNVFRQNWDSTTIWDWSLESPYE